MLNTLATIEKIIQNLEQEQIGKVCRTMGNQQYQPSNTTKALIGGFNPDPETSENIAKLESALAYLSPDVPRGKGNFYDEYGQPSSDYWLAAIWAIAGLNWNSGKAIAKKWSQQSDRYSDEGFEKDWNAFNPNKPSPISVASIYKRARELGWLPPSVQSTLQITHAPAIGATLDQIDELNLKFAWDLSEMNLYNIDTGSYVLKDRFTTQYANRKIDVGTGQQPKIMALGAAWLSHSRRRNTPRVVMAPSQPSTLPDGSVNSWRGFNCEPSKGDVRPFIKLLKRLIPNIEERRYVLSWLAALIQSPAQKFNVALVIWSREQGTGKSLLVETVGNLFDDRHFEVVGQEVFNDGFTDWQAHKVMVICDEVSSTDKRAVADRIKGWITASKNNINAKHAPKFKQPNLIKYVFLSNHADAVYLDETDRRFFVVEATSVRLPKDDSVSFVKWRDNGGYAALLHYLQNLQTKDFNPTAPAPLSLSKEAMVEDNKSDLERWLDGVLAQRIFDKNFLISSEELASSYKTGTGHSCSSKTITSALRSRGVERLNKQARMEDGSKKRLFALQDSNKYELMSDAELGKEFSNQIF
jgi:hypothetical protein